MEILILALVAGTGLTFTIVRLLPFHIIHRYNIWIDATFTIGLPVLLAGSFSGMTLAILSGIVMSVELAILKAILPKPKQRT